MWLFNKKDSEMLAVSGTSNIKLTIDVHVMCTASQKAMASAVTETLMKKCFNGMADDAIIRKAVEKSFKKRLKDLRKELIQAVNSAIVIDYGEGV